jgi:hypothetical protein
LGGYTQAKRIRARLLTWSMLLSAKSATLPQHALSLTGIASLSISTEMANKPRTPRSAAETKRLAEALRVNLLKRKSLAKARKSAAKGQKQASD